MEQTKTRKKLIEVALPLDKINAASSREKSIRHGHPSTLHLWWARRPLAAARAVLFSQLVDDPSDLPEEFPTEEEQKKERDRLFKIIEDLVVWENTTNERVLEKARAEIRRSWRRTCADNRQPPARGRTVRPGAAARLPRPLRRRRRHPPRGPAPRPRELRQRPQPGGRADQQGHDRDPAQIRRPRPRQPGAQYAGQVGISAAWKGATGLAEDVRYYGKWMRDEAEKRIGHLYPKVEVTAEMAAERPDLKRYVGRKLTVIAWLWARTVRSPNPAFADVEVPLASTFILSKKKGKEAYVEPVIGDGGYHFTVKAGRRRSRPAEGHEAVPWRELPVSDVRCANVTYDYIRGRRQSRAHEAPG